MDDNENQGRVDAATTGAPRTLAAFDFDGTLTVEDSFRAYLRWKSGAVAYLAGYIRLIPAVARYLFDRDRGSLKAAMVGLYLHQMPRAELERSAESFAAGAFDRLIRPDALATWRRHQAEGATVVIVTASPDVLVQPFARRLGADQLLGTRLTFDSSDRVIGALEGANCRGAEKVRRLREAFGDDVRLEAAYGDSRGDIEMLAIAKLPGMKVFTGRP